MRTTRRIMSECALIFVLIFVVACLTTQEKEKVDYWKKTSSDASQEYNAALAEETSLKQAIGNSTISPQNEAELRARLEEAEKKTIALRERLAIARQTASDAKEEARRIRLTRGVEIAEWANGGVSTLLSFTPWAAILAPILGIVGSVIASYKKNITGV